MSEPKHEETFKVVDRRLFTPEGELRKDVAEQQDRERDATASHLPSQSGPSALHGTAPTPAGAAKQEPRGAEQPAPASRETPKRSVAFENLIRSLGQNAAMLLGGYADPRTGQPMLDLEGAREVIDMLDALRDKTRSNLTPEEDTLLLDITGNLKLAFMEMTKTAAAAVQEKVKSRS